MAEVRAGNADCEGIASGGQRENKPLTFMILLCTFTDKALLLCENNKEVIIVSAFVSQHTW